MAAPGDRITVGTTATLLLDSTDTDNVAGVSGTLRMVGAGPVVLGDATVTAATGFEWDKAVIGPVFNARNLVGGDKIYGIVASGSCVVHRLRVGT